MPGTGHDPEAFKRAMGRYPRSSEFARFIPETPKPLDAAAMYHYWHPDRPGVLPAPARTAKALADISPKLAICRAPDGAPVPTHAWTCWYRKPEVTHWLSPGWFLFFVWQEKDIEYREDKGEVRVFRPLSLDDPRMIANIFRFSVMGEFKSAEAHFRNVCDQIVKGKERTAKADQDRRDDIRKDFWESRKIKNIGKGNKFARHHDGGVVETRGDRDWRLARGTKDDPQWVTDDAKRAAERRADKKGR